ncbi:Undecaprenyl-phosphate galactose phosphotransferase, WbaP/exopolysaccharide biosynthesis polyprenyl glycosylphosphotransferase [Geodermatophilus telluris]|uniref:Undecaprenyl-phosphate galactose phosphotransferase, WbaP/exopolysaccharide biosynthesis polyprenyl glycosylphosphotransferase n=1 Tax=Geodermatophilus telluris TaxID=1190417 RepID=A0A1G6M1C9_9ACTN|nr:sugar transferase [Geodermatophilus telluris]SDC49342.1 Undecaprenyl-phosphate galactose phosphotransferase, WbaP/exopolysaccharide biosynthesis polyprenyl glycosylphosphotransferase [Geodermatophilus telluris]
MLLDHLGAGRGTATAAVVPVPRLVPDAVAVAPAAARPAGARRWAGRYAAALVAGEVAAAATASAAVLLAHSAELTAGSPLLWAAGALPLSWPLLLLGTGAHDERVFGTGSEEYRRVARAGFLLLALASLVSYVGQLELSRALVLVAVPALTAVTLLVRLGARWQLRRLRARGRCTKRVVVVGRGGAVAELVTRLRRERAAGLEVVAACVTPESRARVADALGVPVGGLDDVAETAARLGADTIAVTSASETAAEYLRRLSWQLEGTGVELLVAPGLIEVAGPRLHIRPFEGLPLLSVEQPRFEGWQRVVKGGLDRVAAALAIVLVAPVLLAIAAAVKLTSPGPLLYRQERVGVNGRSFTMYKFRSMVVDADRQVDALRTQNISDGLLFKVRADPRVTPVGRLLRRLSLDELPQLLNVLGGTMSLVGPRPPLPSEVARYDSSVHRRLLVKPGLTGLWQVSGRSDLPWEEAVRLDLRYVENWSLTMDLLILVRTVRAVLGRSGAY